MALEPVNNNFDNNYDYTIDSYTNFLNNEYAVAGITLFLILYAALIAPRLPRSILKWFNNWLVQLILFFAILYISTKNITIALITTLAVIITIMVAKYNADKKIIINTEKFSGCGSCSNAYDNISDNSDTDDYHYGNYRKPKSKDTVYALDINVMDNDNDEITGIMDELIEEHDGEIYGMANSNMEGAMTSMNGPNMSSNGEIESTSEESEMESEMESEIESEMDSDMDSDMGYSVEPDMGFQIENNMESEMEYTIGPNNVVAIEENQSEEEAESNGWSLDESEMMPMGEEQANYNEIITEVENEGPVSAEEFIQNVVEQVTNNVEEENGVVILQETQEEVTSEVSDIVSKIARRRPVSEIDVISVCREVYRRKL